MKMRTLVWRELFERKVQMLTIFLGVALGITTVVAIKNVSFYSKMAVARELDSLGANVLVLPKSVTLQDYYSADMHGEVLPEEYVTRLTLSEVEGVDNLSPKLCVPVELGGREFTLTGILPKSEFRAKAAWGRVGIFSRPIGCGVVDPTAQPEPQDKRTLVRTRVIETLESDEVLVGADVAEILGVEKGQTLKLLGKSFNVIAILPQTGTVDDSRIFAHLHTVQDLADSGPVINCIEIVGCCKQIRQGLVDEVNKLLPDAKVITVTQVVDTQVKLNQMMERLSLIFVAIIVVLGGAGIANYMYANVHERRREIGTLMALGANSFLILRVFLAKALLLGVAGGIFGFLAGTALAVTLGPKLANVDVRPMPMLAVWAVLISAAITAMASFFPARHAARMDPCATLQEV